MFQLKLNKIKKNPPRDFTDLQALSFRSVNFWAPFLGVIAWQSVVIFLIEGLISLHKENGFSEAASIWIYALIALILVVSLPFLLQLAVFIGHRKLFRIGVWVNAKVLQVKLDRLGLESRLSRLFPIKILVSYKTKQGKPVEAWVLCYQRWFFGKLKMGEEVNICYHPNDPGKAFLIESYLL